MEVLSWYELLEYFALYSFVGWCLEVAYAALKTGELVNRGFLNGPVCPIYGTGMVVVLELLRMFPAAEGSNLALFFGGMFLASGVELLGGWALYKIYHARWWDYSDRHFNLGGFICLEMSLVWGFGAIVVIRAAHPFLSGVLALVPQAVGWWLLLGLYVVFGVDFALTVFTAAGLNRTLTAMDKASAEIRSVSDRLTVLVGNTALDAEGKVDESRLQMALAKAEAADRVEAARDKAEESYRAARSRYLQARQKARDEYDQAMEDARITYEEAENLYRVELEKRRAQLELKKAALRKKAGENLLWGEGRLLRAFPDLAKARLGRGENGEGK